MAPSCSSRIRPLEVNPPPRLASLCQETRCTLEEVERGSKELLFDCVVTARPPPERHHAEAVPHRFGRLIHQGGAVELRRDVTDAADELVGGKAPALTLFGLAMPRWSSATCLTMRADSVV